MASGVFPADLTTEVGQVRLNIGDFDPPTGDDYIVSDDIIQFTLDRYAGETSIVRLYRATIDVLTYLKSKYAQEGARTRKRESGLEVEVYANELYQNICDLLKYWENNPPPATGITLAIPIIGGVEVTEYDRVRADTESIGGGYSLAEVRSRYEGFVGNADDPFRLTRNFRNFRDRY